MTTEVFATKDPAAIQNLAFDFSPDLGSETLTGASQTSGIEVLAGTDASPSNVLNGAPIPSGTLVVQSVKAGVAGVGVCRACSLGYTDADEHSVASSRRVARFPGCRNYRQRVSGETESPLRTGEGGRQAFRTRVGTRGIHRRKGEIVCVDIKRSAINPMAARCRDRSRRCQSHSGRAGRATCVENRGSGVG